jgi:hypothetical protein
MDAADRGQKCSHEPTRTLLGVAKSANSRAELANVDQTARLGGRYRSASRKAELNAHEAKAIVGALRHCPPPASCRRAARELHAMRLPRRAGPEPVATVRGVNLYAKQRVDGRDRKQLERLCRYVTRPPVAEDRLERRADGRWPPPSMARASPEQLVFAFV